ncbi:MAG: hypothetical protein LUP91_12095 [Methylococcaceae bacterium]|nr:hypothetical protein [Methylococcaceae bacterium]
MISIHLHGYERRHHGPVVARLSPIGADVRIAPAQTADTLVLMKLGLY